VNGIFNRFLPTSPDGLLQCHVCHRLEHGPKPREMSHRELAESRPAWLVREAAKMARQKGIQGPFDWALASRMSAELVFDFFGERRFFANNDLLHYTAMALMGADRMVVHRVRSGAARLVHETDLHSLPGEPPRLLRRPFIIEAARPDRGETLFGKTVSLAGYEMERGYWLFGDDNDGAGRRLEWSPVWSAQDLEAGVELNTLGLFGDFGGSFFEWGREAVRFLLVFALLLESDGAPVRKQDERDAIGESRSSKGQKPRGGLWITRNTYLDTSNERAERDTYGDETGSGSGLILSAVTVRGHLRRQRCGPGNREVKWIYITSHESRRWIAPCAQPQ
jgi:hypothetical protein